MQVNTLFNWIHVHSTDVKEALELVLHRLNNICNIRIKSINLSSFLYHVQRSGNFISKKRIRLRISKIKAVIGVSIQNQLRIAVLFRIIMENLY